MAGVGNLSQTGGQATVDACADLGKGQGERQQSLLAAMILAKEPGNLGDDTRIAG